MTDFARIGRPPIRYPGLREMRERRRKLSQIDLRLEAVAEACGISASTLSRIERGEAKASRNTLRTLAACYMVTEDTVIRAYKETQAEGARRQRAPTKRS